MVIAPSGMDALQTDIAVRLAKAGQQSQSVTSTQAESNCGARSK
jgi:hypothetical protein